MRYITKDILNSKTFQMYLINYLFICFLQCYANNWGPSCKIVQFKNEKYIKSFVFDRYLTVKANFIFLQHTVSIVTFYIKFQIIIKSVCFYNYLLYQVMTKNTDIMVHL